MNDPAFLRNNVWLGRIAAVVMPLCMILIWPIVRPYDGMDRDGHLYAVQAMAHVHPGRYANDLFFLFGSQDSFTILTRLISPLYGWLGIDHASALLTVAGALAWWSACWMLSRAVGGPRIAWLSLALVMVAPGWYGGGGEVFRYAETYFGARLPAEALVLMALALQLRGRALWGLAALAVSFVIHPLMTLPGLALFVLMQAPVRGWPWLILLATALVLLLTSVAALAPFGRLQVIDQEWLEILRSRSSFLFPFNWTSHDWHRVLGMHCLLLAAVSLIQRPQIRRLAFAGTVIGAGGMLLAVLIGEFVPVELMLQAQPWRVLWLASVLAYLLVPVAVLDAWGMGPYARASAVLLIAAVCALSSTTFLAAAAAALFVAALPNRAKLPHGHLAITGAIAAASLTILFSLLSALTVLKVPVWAEAGGAYLEHLRNVFGLVLPGIGLVVLLLTLQQRPTWPRLGAALAILSALTAATAAPVAREFMARPYSGDAYSQFADWRERIPPGTNVLWPISPVYAWFWLERPSYISVSQLAGIIFSRDLAMESVDRIRSLAGFADENAMLIRPGSSDQPFGRLTPPLLAKICQDDRIGFVVADDQLAPDALAKAWPDQTKKLFLHDCRPYRQTDLHSPT